MRTREEIAKCLSKMSAQLIELTINDLQGEEKDRVSKIIFFLDGVLEDIEEELSKNELAALSQETPKESNGYFVGGYYYEFQTKEELEESEKEAIASGAGFDDIYPQEY